MNRKTPHKAAAPLPEQAKPHVETAAYFLAEKSGFSGEPADHWIRAEEQIRRMIADGSIDLVPHPLR